jgi:hypothetical protein
MTSATSTIQGETFVASASSEYQGIDGIEDSWMAFNQDTSEVDPNPCWTVSGFTLYNSDGTYAGSVSTTALDDGIVRTYTGEWLQLECPRPMSVDTIRIKTRSVSLTRGPEEYVVVGSNDGSSWFTVLSITGRTTWTTDGYTEFVQDKTPYSYWRLIVTKKIDGGDPWCSIGEFGLFSRRSRIGTLVNSPTQNKTVTGLEYLEFNGTNQL